MEEIPAAPTPMAKSGTAHYAAASGEQGRLSRLRPRAAELPAAQQPAPADAP